MKKAIRHLISFLFLLSACTSQATATLPTGPQTITIMTHDSFSVSEKVIQSFEEANNAEVVFLQSGDAGSMLNRAILTEDAPLADLLFGVDNTFLSRALEEDIFEPYNSPLLAEIPDSFELDASHGALPVDYGDVCINYDKAYFAENNLAVPQSLEDLTKPEYEGLLVVENPATSSTGLAFLLATVAHFGDSFSDYWQDLKDNGVVIVDGWETAYYNNFSGSSGRGPQPLVVSYGSSPAAEVVYANPPVDDAPTASIVGTDTCFRQIEFVGILKGTEHRPLAERFVDFMLSKEFQEDVPLQMFVYPVNPNADLPEAFTRYAQAPEQAASLSPEEINANRDAWIQAWAEVMLR